MKCRISSALLSRLRAQADAAKGRECCGLLVGSPGRIDEAVAIPNAAAKPERFELDVTAHLAASRSLRAAGKDVVGCYHSHPSGSAEPSDADAQAAVQPGFYWLILGEPDTRLWLSRPNGPVLGRFAPVALEVEASTALQPDSAGANRKRGTGGAA